ncbi:hypothetical protein ACTXT7_009518 [Hymenolepis weldensis]
MDLIEFSCGECGQTFETSNGLQNHVDTEHEVVLTDRDQSDPNLINENIEPSANQANGPVSHDLRTRHSLYSSANKSIITSLQADTMPYCNICDKSFANHHGHLIHNGRYHKGLLETNGENNDENRSNEENIEDTAAPNPNVSYCKECDKSFGNNHGLLIHNGRYHKNPEAAQQIDNNSDVVAVVQSTESEQGKGNNSFPCEPCGKTYDTYHGLLIHNGRYHKDTTTSTRRRRLTCPPNLMNSEKVDYKESGLFSCDDCSKSFNTFSEFIAHANLYHSEPPKDDEGKGKSIRGSIAKTPAKDKHAAASEERGKRKSVQISDGKQLDEEGEEAQPTTSREKRRLSRGSCANSDLDETQTTNGRGKRRRVSRRSYADYDYDDYVLHACDECDKSYPTYHGLLIHQGRNHKQSTPIVDKRQENRESKNITDMESQAEDSNLFVCNDCNKTFDTYHGFLIHAGRYHKSPENPNSEERISDSKVQIENGSEAVEIDISTYSCDGCDKSFHSEHGLLIHTGRAHHRSSPSRKRRRKLTKKATQGNSPAEVIDVDNEPTDGNGQIAETINGADPAESNETPEVNERTQNDADAAENNGTHKQISEVNEPPADPPTDAPPEENNETSEVNEQTVDAPNDTAPMENSGARADEAGTKDPLKAFP